MQDETKPGDKQKLYFERFDKVVRDRLKALVTDAMIEAHRRSPAGPHDDATERVLNYFRRAAVKDKYAALAVKPFAEYRLMAMSGRRGVTPRFVSDEVFTSEDEVQHAIFLRRIADLMAS